MKIGIVSDTHRNKAYLEQAVDWLLSNYHIASLFHLGDDYEDVVDLVDLGIDIVQVPGIYHQKYLDGTLSPKQIEHILGIGADADTPLNHRSAGSDLKRLDPRPEP